MKRKSKLTIAVATAVPAVLGGGPVYAQDKYALKSPGGIEFSDFKGYEDWAVVSSARTDEVLKVIVANPTMIEAADPSPSDCGHVPCCREGKGPHLPPVSEALNRACPTWKYSAFKPV